MLRSDSSNSLRAIARLWGAAEQYRPWGDFLYSVQTGEPAFEYLYETSVFEYYARKQDAGRIFDEAMTNVSTQIAQDVVRLYDFSELRTVIDIGGGYGTLLVAILRKYPTLRGVLFDAPHVIEQAATRVSGTDVCERLTLVGGDFLATVPPGGDGYLMSEIVHGCDDETCVDLLRRCHEVIPANGKLVMIEFVLPAGPEPSLGKWSDLHMLVMTGGRERTAAEYEFLLDTAGFELTRVLPTTTGLSLIEATPA